MFSSIASFLPSALHINPSSDLPRPTVNPDDPQTEDEDDLNLGRSVPPQREADPDQPARGKDKDCKAPTETFIFVRPPPSKSNHPLNLQVQLVPPNAKPPSGVTSSDGAATTPTSANSTGSTGSDGASLARTVSNTSDASFAASSYGSSTTSFTSVASSAGSSSSSRRAIVPLYNLQAHNVMTNVIVDAGTDAKIARFQKRGIELIDLALLEPVEVWGEKDKEKDARRESMRISVDEAGAMVTNLSNRGSLMSAKSIGGFLQPGGGSRPTTPSAASSNASLHSHSQQAHTSSNLNPSSNSSNIAASVQAPVVQNAPLKNSFLRPSDSRRSMKSEMKVPVPAPAPVSPPPVLSPPKRNIFNKLFNKRNSVSSSSSSLTISQSQPSQPASTTAQTPTDPPPSFASFSLHPAPVSAKIIARDFEKPQQPSLPALQPPQSPISSTSQQTTPTEPQTPRQDEPVSPTPTVAPPKERGHGRNLSLTSIAMPLKATLKNNKNRISAVLGSSSLGGGGIEERASRESLQTTKRDVSPNPSVARSNRSRLSFVGTMNTTETQSTESSGTTKDGNGNILPQPYSMMVTQTQPQDVSNLKQQQLQLRPPVLGIQPTFVSSTPSAASQAASSNFVSALSPRVSENSENVLQGQRALMYVWLVRRWLKKKHSSLLSGIAGGIMGAAHGGGGSDSGGGGFFGKSRQGSSHSAHAHAPLTGLISQELSNSSGSSPLSLPFGGVEVRFEWKRAKGKDSKRGGAKRSRRGRASSRKRSMANGADSDGEVERQSLRDWTREDDRGGDAKERIKAEEKRNKRMSTGSFSTTTNASDENLPGRRLQREGTVDDGDESDPEDSETPWVCTLKIRRSAAAAVAAMGPNPHGLLSPTGSVFNGVVPLEPQVLRIKVGTLSPTPHHPKVVAMLKVPYPLPDVEVERMGVVKRAAPVPGQKGPPELSGGQDGRDAYTGIVLTAEEIKDVVCSTGFWLVVREGFGGVGKISRKGDGWRIRA